MINKLYNTIPHYLPSGEEPVPLLPEDPLPHGVLRCVLHLLILPPGLPDNLPPRLPDQLPVLANLLVSGLKKKCPKKVLLW